jgi:hypothetical protein
MKKFYIKFMLIAFVMIAINTNGQTIPNNSFDNWTNMGSYNNPDGWSTYNDLTTAAGVYTCVKGTPGLVGMAYLKLTSKNVIGLGVVPGVAISGVTNMQTLEPVSGFPMSSRPAAFEGTWQYMAFGADQGFIAVAMTQWNTLTSARDTVGYAYYALPGMEMSWVNFSIPINYLNGNDPDSCFIILSASKANGATASANSYLYVEEIFFSGNVTGTGVNEFENISIYPNPASDLVSIQLDGRAAGDLVVTNSIGQTFFTQKISNGQANLKVETGKWVKGLYYFTLKNDRNSVVKTISIQ